VCVYVSVGDYNGRTQKNTSNQKRCQMHVCVGWGGAGGGGGVTGGVVMCMCVLSMCECLYVCVINV